MTIDDAATASNVCVSQGTTAKIQIENFLIAYTQCKTTSLIDQDVEKLEEFILFLARIIEPEINKEGYRKRTSNLKGDGEDINGDKLKRVVQSFCKAFIEANLKPEELYDEFKQISPFADGNGRLSDLVWRLAHKKQTGNWPLRSRPKNTH